MMRVLYIAQDLDLPESHMIAGIADRGAQVSLLLPPDLATPEVLAGRVGRADARLAGRVDRQTIRTIRDTVREQRVDLVHCLRGNRPVSNALLALRGLSRRIVCYRGTMGNLSRWNPGARMTYLHRRLDRIVCVSEGVRRSLAGQGVAAKRLVTIYKGHDPAWYRSGSRPDLAQFGIPHDAFVVCCTANMRPLKGIDVLIQSASHLATARRVHYLLVGEVRDPGIRELARCRPHRDIIHLAGYRTDAVALSGGCDLFVMPSLRREGLPRAVIEAMCQAVPAVVTDVGGMPELVVHGDCGLVVPPGDPAAIGGAISRFAEDAGFYARCARQSIERIRATFSVEQTVDKTWSMYAEVVGGRSRSRG